MDDRAIGVWICGSRGWVSLWQGPLFAGDLPTVRMSNLWQVLRQRILDTAHPPPMPPSPPSTVRKLESQVRVMGRSFADATGPCHVRFCSWFPALRIWRDDRDRALRQLDEVTRYWQGLRLFAAVGALPYWAGREVLPSWSNYDELVAGVLRACQERGLKVHLTTGDMQVLFPGGVNELAAVSVTSYQGWQDDGLDLRWMADTGQRSAAAHRRVTQFGVGSSLTDAQFLVAQTFNQRLGQIVAAIGAEVVACREIWNEGYQNNAYGDDPSRAGDLARAWRAMCPAPLIGLSAPATNEEPQGLFDWSQAPAQVAMIHGSREANCMERAFGLAQWYALEGGVGKPFWQGEPTGPNTTKSSQVYQPTNDHDILFGLYLMHVMTGQATNYFNSPSILYGDGEALEDGWGFRELPALMNLLPEDIGQWPHVRHGNTGSKEAPWSARSFADPASGGRGPARVDQVWHDDGRFAAMVYGGTGAWEVYPVRRSARYQIVSKDGIVAEGRVSAGQTLAGLDASMTCRLLLGTME